MRAQDPIGSAHAFEGDCKVIFDALNDIGSRGFHVQTIIDNCLSFCSHFRSLSFFFCFRDCNGIAHRLAKWAACGLSQEVWDGAGLTWLEAYTLIFSFICIN